MQAMLQVHRLLEVAHCPQVSKDTAFIRFNESAFIVRQAEQDTLFKVTINCRFMVGVGVTKETFCIKKFEEVKVLQRYSGATFCLAL